MDTLFETINSLSPHEEKQLLDYLDYKSGAKSRIKKLFQLLSGYNEPETEVVIHHLYNLADQEITIEKRNAYYQWRSRLSNSIEEFILQQVTTEDTSPYIIKLTLVARFLFSRKKYKAAFKYLQKAEDIAEKVSNYELMHLIYSMQIDYSWVNTELNIQELLLKWKKNAELLSREISLKTALGVLHFKIVHAHKTRNKIDIDQLTKDIFQQYNIDIETSYMDINMRYKIAMLVKIIFEEKALFSELAKYLEDTYQDMEKKQLFDKYNHKIKVELLTDICNAAIKGKQYVLGEKYLDLVKKEHDAFPNYIFLNVKYIMTRYVLLITNNRLEEAIEIINEVDDSYLSKIVQEDDYYFRTINANLLSAKYFLNDIAAAKKHLIVLLNNEKRIRNLLGQGGVFCCQLMDCIVNFDLKEYEYVLTKIKAVRKRFAAFLKQPENERYQLFLKIISAWAAKQDILNNEDIKKTVSRFLRMEQPAVGKGEFIPFTSWIRARSENIRLYDVFLDTVKA